MFHVLIRVLFKILDPKGPKPNASFEKDIAPTEQVQQVNETGVGKSSSIKKVHESTSQSKLESSTETKVSSTNIGSSSGMSSSRSAFKLNKSKKERKEFGSPTSPNNATTPPSSTPKKKLDKLDRLNYRTGADILQAYLARLKTNENANEVISDQTTKESTISILDQHIFKRNYSSFQI
jgi:cell division septation protein DedD